MISLAATKFMNEQFEVDHNGCFEEVWAGLCSHLDGRGRVVVMLCYLLFSLSNVTGRRGRERGGGGGWQEGAREDGRLRLESEMKEDMKWKEAERGSERETKR